MPQLDRASRLRRSRSRYATMAMLIASTLTSSRLWSQDLSRIRIDNFGQINQNYYRGGQPKQV